MHDDIRDIRDAMRAATMSADELRALQERKLQHVVRYASRHVPYYRHRFKEEGMMPEDIDGLEDLKLMPVTRKRDLQLAGPEGTVAEPVGTRACTVAYTSGSTGTPLPVYLGKRDALLRNIVELRSLMQIGFSPMDRLASLGPHRARRPGILTRLGLYKTMYVSISSPVTEQIRQLVEFQPTFLWIYPTVLRALYQTMKCRLSDYIQPRCILFSSEVLDEVLRAWIRDDFGVDPINFYGCIEVGRVAWECTERQGLHVNLDHVILENLQDDDEPGGLVVTGLNARSMPFLRYELGDHVARVGRRCSCGSQLPLICPPQGRQHDLLVLPSGRRLPPVRYSAALRLHTDILKYRFTQTRIDGVVLELVLRTPWSTQRTEQLRQEMLDQLGETIDVEIRCVDDIEDEKSKFRSFVSRLPREILDARPGAAAR